MNNVFEDLFVLEMTNNHLGSLERGLKIIDQFSKVVRFNGVRAAIKVQFRDVSTFVHKDFRTRTDIRYIKRVVDTHMPKTHYDTLLKAVRASGCVPMATPFDEQSVDWCVEFGLPIIKVASADSNCWTLLEKVATTKKPVIVSVGGLSLKDMDDMVKFFENRSIPLALNHCVASYPHDACECELNQIDYLRTRYTNHTIGYSSHEHGADVSSVAMAYAKGARTFERHIDVAGDSVAAYSALPEHIDAWFKEWNRAKDICGSDGAHRKQPGHKEVAYLDSYVRGVYASRDLTEGEYLSADDIYMAIPLQRGQLSSRELMFGKFGLKIAKRCAKDAPITLNIIDGHYTNDMMLSLGARGI